MQEGNQLALNSQLLIDMEGLMKDMEQVDLHLAFENIPEKVILLLGETKAGKTTLMYYLLGKKLIRERDETMGLFYMKPQAKIFDALIGNNYDSTTVYPNIPTELGQDNVLIIDMPGFSDTRYGFRLLNIYIIREVIKKIRSVHVSLVISNEFLEANSLSSIIQRNCRLLNKDLLASPGCFSFILTKIEDKQAQLELFEESLKQLEEEVGIMQEIDTINKAKTYSFQNNSPRVEEGVELKLKIISENKFYPTNYLPENLLSQQYADVILGQDIQEDFYDFIVEMLSGLERILSQLIWLFSEVVKFHHAAELASLFSFQAEGLAESITSIASELNIGEISSLQIKLDEPFNQPQDAVRFLNLAKKYYRVDEKPLKDGSVQAVLATLQNFIEWSKLLEAEESPVSKELREKMHKIFKFCSSCLKTITYIKSTKVAEQCQYLCQSSTTIASISQYRQFAKQSEILTRIAHHEIGSKYLSQNQEFKEILLAFFPSFAFEEGEEVIEKVRARGRIKNKKIDAALAQTTKDTSRPVQKEERFANINITQMNKDTIGTIRNMPIGSYYLRIVLRLAFKFQSELQGSNDPTQIEFGIALLRKAATILQKLGMLEIAIMFYLAVASELQAEQLINTAISFRQLSEEFIKLTLLPYYSTWSPSFQMVEKLHNYLSLHAYDINVILDNQREMVETFERMHEIDYQQLPILQRFEFAFIECFSQHNNQFAMLQQAERAESLLKTSKMTNLKDELYTLTSL